MDKVRACTYHCAYFQELAGTALFMLLGASFADNAFKIGALYAILYWDWDLKLFVWKRDYTQSNSPKQLISTPVFMPFSEPNSRAAKLYLTQPS